MNAPVSPFTQSMQAAAAALPLPPTGPAWLVSARREALDAFLQRGLPDTHNELWKYTALRALLQRQYAAVDPLATLAVDSALWQLPGIAGPRIVFVNGVYRADLSQLAGLPEGVTLTPLAAALAAQPESMRFLLGGHARDTDDGWTLLNRALAADGVVIRVAAGCKVAVPLHIVHVGVATAAAVAGNLRGLIELGADASLSIVEHHVGDAEAAHLTNLVRTVAVRERAQLDWTVLQRAGGAATLLRRSDLTLYDDAHVDFHALELGGKLARNELRVELAGARARFDAHGAFVLHGRQHCDSEILVTHRGRDTVSKALWRGVADGHARGVVHGRILVQPGADGADGSFYNKNLLLSPDAEIDTRPALEIYADEVKANHGATVGQLDDMMLFYLRSRGVPLAEARLLLVRAFCAAALEGMRPEALREHCAALLAERLPEPGA